MASPPVNVLAKDTLLLILLLLGGAVLAYVDHQLGLHTILVETIHALVVTAILIFCWRCQQKYPEIQRYGWNKIVWGVAFLMIGSWIDILDDPPTLHLLNLGGVPFGRSWEQAFLKKILGYTAGIGMIAAGFFQWIPWMIEARLKVERLNQTLSQTNKHMSLLLMNLDERVESERLRISRELHDDVAQQLTSLTIQMQLCEKSLTQAPETTRESLVKLRGDVSDALKSVRHISQNLRPESLYSLGLIPALDQFIDKLKEDSPEGLSFNIQVNNHHTDDDPCDSFESRFSDRELLHVFRLIQEGVRNAVKHSEARHIQITLSEFPDHCIIDVDDNGKGLPWKALPQDDTLVQQGHLGVAGMHERASEIDAKLSLITRPDFDGTRLEIVINR